MTSLDNAGDDLFQELFKIGSVGFKVFPGSDWEGNLRIYLFEHPQAVKYYGQGLSFEQSIANMFKVFARYGKNEENLAHHFGISSAWSPGMRFVKTIANRRLAIAIAHGETQLYFPHLSSEKNTELYVRQQINKWTFVSPHLLIAKNLKGTEKDMWLFGLRTQFNF